MKEYSKSELNKVIRGSNRATYDVDAIHAILDASFLCNIGYEFENQIIVIPTAYGRKEDKIYIHGSLKSRMLLSLLKKDEVSLSVTHLDGLVLARSAFHHSANYRSAAIFGSVKKVEDPEEKLAALKCIMDHMVPGHWNNVRHPNKKEFNATLVLEISIKTASAKIRGEGAIDEKEDYKLPIWAGVIPISQVVHDPVSEPDLPNGVTVPDSVLQFVERNKCKPQN